MTHKNIIPNKLLNPYISIQGKNMSSDDRNELSNNKFLVIEKRLPLSEFPN